MIPLLLLALAAMACNLGAQPPQATATIASTGAPTLVSQSDLPEVVIRTPSDGSQVIVGTKIDIYVSAVDKIGVTRVEMRINNAIVDTAASVDPRGTPRMDSLLSWTPSIVGPAVVQVVAYRNNIKGNPATINLQVVTSAKQVTLSAASPAFLTASPTNDPTCRVQVTVDGLNLRSGPGTNYDSLANLGLGQTLIVYGRSADGAWWQIGNGWVSASYARPLGVCSTALVLPAPASPTPQAGQTLISILPTWTPLPPTAIQPSATTTLFVVVLPTLTPSPFVQPTARQASIGDLTSTAIFATQTALAASPTPTATLTASSTGITATAGPTGTPTSTPTVTATPTRPNLVVINTNASPPTVILDAASKIATLRYTVRVQNTGSALAPVFDVSVRTSTQAFTAPTTIILDPGAQTDVQLDVVFTQPGLQNITIVADPANVVANEIDKNDNVLIAQVNVLEPTVQGPSPTATLTFTPVPTDTPIPTVTPLPSDTPAPTETATNTLAAIETATETATSTSTPTLTGLPVSETATPTATQCPLATPELLAVAPLPPTTNDPQITLTVNAGGNVETITVTVNGIPLAPFTAGTPVIVPLQAGPNTISVSATYKLVTSADGCVYGGYALAVNTASDGTPLVITYNPPVASTATPTETATATLTETPAVIAVVSTETPTAIPTETPTETATVIVCLPPPVQVITVQPLPPETATNIIAVVVDPNPTFESITANVNGVDQAPVAPGTPLNVTLQAGPNTIIVRARVRQETDANGCVTGGVDVSAAPLTITYNVPVPPTETPTETPTVLPTETPTETPTPFVCPPPPVQVINVQPLPPETTTDVIAIVVDPNPTFESITANVNGVDQASVAPGTPLNVTLQAGPNTIVVRARVRQETDANGCVTGGVEVSAAPLIITYNVPVPPTAIPTETPTTAAPPPFELVDLGKVGVISNFEGETVKNLLLNGRSQGLQYNDFSLVGANTLASLGAVNQPGTNLDQFNDALNATTQFYATGFTSIAQRAETCRNNNFSPEDCAGQLGLGITFVDLGGAARASNQPLDQFQTELDGRIKSITSRGIIPVLVTLAGPQNDQATMQVNTVIFRVAEANKVPLLNLYRLGTDKPQLLNNDQLTAPPAGTSAADFTQPILDQFGVNNANLAALQLLNEIKKVIDANP